MFITDGNPNVVVNENNVTQTEYETKVPLSESETTNTNEDQAADRAVSNANGLKALRSHTSLLPWAMVSLAAIPSGDSSASQDPTSSLTTPTSTFRQRTSTGKKTSPCSRTRSVEAAFQLCAPSVTIRKLLDQDPNPGIHPTTSWYPVRVGS